MSYILSKSITFRSKCAGNKVEIYGNFKVDGRWKRLKIMDVFKYIFVFTLKNVDVRLFIQKEQMKIDDTLDKCNLLQKKKSCHKTRKLIKHITKMMNFVYLFDILIIKK